MTNIKKITTILLLVSMMPFCFAHKDKEELSTQDLCKKHVLGNSIKGAATCFAIGTLSSFVPFGVNLMYSRIKKGPLFNPISTNLTKGSAVITALCSSVSAMKYASANLVPYAAGFLVGSQFIIPRFTS